MKIRSLPHYRWFVLLVDAVEAGRAIRLMDPRGRPVDDPALAARFASRSDAEWFLGRTGAPDGYRAYCEEIRPPRPPVRVAYRPMELFADEGPGLPAPRD